MHLRMRDINICDRDLTETSRFLQLRECNLQLAEDLYLHGNMTNK